MNRHLRRTLAVTGAAVALVAVVLVWRAARFTSHQLVVAPSPSLPLDTMAAAQRLAGAIRIHTESVGDGPPDSASLAQLARYLGQTFPAAHAALHVEHPGFASLLYSWPGSDAALPPLVLMAHMDVVPVDSGSLARWSAAPFAGTVDSGFVWGRGALDDKSGVLGILEATESLVGAGFRPRRTVMLAFGADEETGGHGAQASAQLLESRGVRPYLVLDEGGAVLRETLPGIAEPVALVGIAEKGYASMQLTARAQGGHSSQPPRETAIGMVSRAVTRLEAHPRPATIEGATAAMLEYAGPEMPFSKRIIFANQWLFRPLVLRALTATAAANATVRTTMAPTMLIAGVKDNVLPTTATAVLNFRLLPDDSAAGVLEYARRTIDDPAIDVAHYGSFRAEPSSVSSTSSLAFTSLTRTIRATMPGVVVAPYLTIGGTDARYYSRMSDNVYRFIPLALESRDLARMHGLDERVSIAGYARAIGFYRQLITSVAGTESR